MRLRKLCFAAAAITAAIALTGCPNDSGPPGPGSVTLTPSERNVVAGALYIFSFDVAVGPPGASQAVTWSFLPETPGVTLADGVLTIQATVPATTTLTVRATAVGHPGVYDQATVNVTGPRPTAVNVTAQGLTPPYTLVMGGAGSVQFNAAVLPVSALQDVEWTLETDPPVAAGIDISATGLLTVSETVDEPVAITVRATTTGYPDGNTHGEATVNVIRPAPQSVEVVTYGGAPATKVAGAPLQLTATVYPPLAYGRVTWEARPYSDSVVPGAISDAGVFNVSVTGTMGGLGDWQIRALTVADPSVYNTGWKTVNVTAPPVTGISAVSPESAMITSVGGSQQFTATTLPHLAYNAVEWSISGEAHGATINADGLLTVPAGVPVDTELTVTATATSTTYSNIATVTITEAAPESVAVAPVGGVPSTVAAGSSLQFAATVTPAQAPGQVTWEARNPSLTAVAGVIADDGTFTLPADGTLGGLGTWTVRAVTVAAPNVASGWVNVAVTAPAVTGIGAVTPASPTVTVSFADGGQLQFTAPATQPFLASNAITWSVSPQPAGVSIDENGLLTVPAGVPAYAELTVTATAYGTSYSSDAIVTVVTGAGATFNVSFATLTDGAAGVTIDGPEISLLHGGTITVTDPAPGSSFSWFLGGTPVNNVDFPGSVYGTGGAELRLSSSTLQAVIGPGNVGTHFVTVIVNERYSRRIAVTVTP